MTARTSASVYETARAEGRAALVGYQPAGFPTYDGCVAALTAMVSAGVDIVEIGLPYSDPVLDGPTIQAAADIALHNSTRTTDVLRTVEAVAATGAAVMVMTYWKPVPRHDVVRGAGTRRAGPRCDPASGGCRPRCLQRRAGGGGRGVRRWCDRRVGVRASAARRPGPRRSEGRCCPRRGARRRRPPTLIHTCGSGARVDR